MPVMTSARPVPSTFNVTPICVSAVSRMTCARRSAGMRLTMRQLLTDLAECGDHAVVLLRRTHRDTDVVAEPIGLVCTREDAALAQHVPHLHALPLGKVQQHEVRVRRDRAHPLQPCQLCGDPSSLADEHLCELVEDIRVL